MKLLFLADENFPRSSYEYLLELGYDIKSIQLNHHGISDEEVIEIGIKEGRLIITFDSDFGELVFRKGYLPKGIIYFRLKTFRPKEPGQYVMNLINDPNIELDGYFTVVDENQVRQRRIKK